MNIALLASGLVGHCRESLAITTINFAKELVGLGHEVTIVTQNKWNGRETELVDGVNFLRIKLRRFPLLSSVYNKLISYPLAFKKLESIDIIHGFSASPVLVLRSLWARMFFARKAKVIHTIKSYPIRRDIKVKGRSAILSRCGDSLYGLLNFADKVTVPTSVHAQWLIAKGVKPGKIKIIPSHVNLLKFYPQDKLELKKDYGYSGKKIIFNYGAMWEIKGTSYLLKSIPEIISRFPQAKFLFAPRNVVASKEKYDGLIRELGIANNLEFISGEAAIEDYVNLADVVVLPYPHLEGTEGNPSCILEALACATPVVTTDLPELTEIFYNSVCFVKPALVNSLVSGILSALKEDNSAVVANGLKLVRDFDVKRITKQFIKLYAEIK